LVPSIEKLLHRALKETFLTGFSQHNKTFQLDIKAVQMACWLCPSREEVGIWIPNRSPAKGQRHTSCRIQILLIHKPATDIRESAQPASTPYSASTNKEPPRHLLKQQQSHTSCYTSWSRGHNLQSVHHNSSTKLGRPHAQSAPTSY